MNTIPPPPYEPITHHRISPRWFPAGRPFGLYANEAGQVAPNVTSILGWKFPFDRSAWVEREPDIDHDAVTAESAERGTAVHQAMEDWLSHRNPSYPEQYAAWVDPLRHLVARAKLTIGVEVPIHHSIPGVGGYAGSCDGLVVSPDGTVVIIDYKTKRPGKRVHPRFLDKQRLQLAAYSIAINEIYGDQLPRPVERCSLLFAHPDRDRPTVVMTEGSELDSYRKQWVNLHSIWYQEHGEAVEAEQAVFDLQHAAS